MKVEVQEYYPYSQDGLEGTMHVYLPEMGKKGMDIRKIKAKKFGAHWKVTFPIGMQVDPDTNENVIFPVISFTDQIEHVDFIQSIRKGCISYLKEMDLSSKKIYQKAKNEKTIKKEEPKQELRHIMPVQKARKKSKFIGKK